MVLVHTPKNKGEIIWKWLVGKCTVIPTQSHTAKKNTLPLSTGVIETSFKECSNIPLDIPQTPPWPNSLCFGIPESFGISGDVRGKLQGVCWGSLRFMKIPPSSHMDVSEKRGTPTSSILIRFYHYKPSILGVFPLFLVQHPYPQPTRRTNWPRTRRWHNRPSHGVT